MRCVPFENGIVLGFCSFCFLLRSFEGITIIVGLVWNGFGFELSLIVMAVAWRWYDRVWTCLGSSCFYYYYYLFTFSPLLGFPFGQLPWRISGFVRLFDIKI